MKIDSVNTSTPQQNFGNLRPITKEVKTYLYNEVFRNNKPVIDKFERAVERVTAQQSANTKFDIQLVHGMNLFTGDACTTAEALTKDGTTISQVHTHMPRYSCLSEEDSVIQMLNDVGNLGPNSFRDLLG